MEPGLPMWYLLPCEARLHAVYRNGKGETFLDEVLNPTGEVTANFQRRYGELSTDVREVISRAIAAEIFAGRGDGDSIWLDFREVPEEYWQSDLPSRYNLRCLVRDFDWKKKPIRISPGALTHLGGIAINTSTETNIPGLYAVGEAAAPVHGSRRRGGNAFTECVVFGARAGRVGAEYARANSKIAGEFDKEAVDARLSDVAAWDQPATPEGEPASIRAEIQRTMWENSGPLRTQERLETCLSDLKALRRDRMPHLYANTPFEVKAAAEMESLLEVGEIVAGSALFREESRGGHFRADIPNVDNENWLCHTLSVRGKPFTKRPIEVTRLPLPKPLSDNHLVNA